MNKIERESAKEGETIPPKTDGLEQLTQQESEQLIELENQIETGAQSMETSALSVGKALREISGRRLYKAEYKTFAAYCEGRWNKSRSYGYRLIQFVEHAEMSPIGDKPQTEGESRKRRIAAKRKPELSKPKLPASKAVQWKSKVILNLDEPKAEFQQLLTRWQTALSAEDLAQVLGEIATMVDDKLSQLEEEEAA